MRLQILTLGTNWDTWGSCLLGCDSMWMGERVLMILKLVVRMHSLNDTVPHSRPPESSVTLLWEPISNWEMFILAPCLFQLLPQHENAVDILFHFVPYRLFKSTCNSGQNRICFMWRCNQWTCPHVGCIFVLLAYICQGKTTSSLLKYKHNGKNYNLKGRSVLKIINHVDLISFEFCVPFCVSHKVTRQSLLNSKNWLWVPRWAFVWDIIFWLHQTTTQPYFFTTAHLINYLLEDAPLTCELKYGHQPHSERKFKNFGS